jgi:hypothetical protein
MYLQPQKMLVKRKTGLGVNPAILSRFYKFFRSDPSGSVR